MIRTSKTPQSCNAFFYMPWHFAPFKVTDIVFNLLDSMSHVYVFVFLYYNFVIQIITILGQDTFIIAF